MSKITIVVYLGYFIEWSLSNLRNASGDQAPVLWIQFNPANLTAFGQDTGDGGAQTSWWTDWEQEGGQ